MLRKLIYVLVSKVFHNDHFWRFGELKMRFPLIRQQVSWSQILWIYLCWDYKYLQRPPFSYSYYFKKVFKKKTVYIFICTVYSVWPMLFPHYCLGVSVFKNMFSTD